MMRIIATVGVLALASAGLARADAPPQQPAAAPVASAPPASGQWLYTAQYGWLWLPYGDQYVYAPPADTSDDYPYLYVYEPAVGWTWLLSPWVWPVVAHPFVRPPLRGFIGGRIPVGGFGHGRRR